MKAHATPPASPGLRERNLARNRAEVAGVAVGLFTARGFDDVTVDDVAAAAGISRRTFFRYFESKEDAVIPYEHERLEQFRELLAERHADEPVVVSIRRATASIVTADDPGRGDIVARLQLIRDNPSIHARSLELRSRWELAVRDVIAENLHEDPATSLVANVAAAATIGATRAAVDVWLATDCAGELATLIDNAFDLLTKGLTGTTTA